jgi:hypothetical protein
VTIMQNIISSSLERANMIMHELFLVPSLPLYPCPQTKSSVPGMFCDEGSSKTVP